MKKNGFTLVELLVAIGLMALFLPVLVNVFSFSLRSASQGEEYTKAYSIAQQQMESIYYLKENDPNWDWNTYPENNSSDDYYQPQLQPDGSWVLGAKTSSPTEVEGFTSTVKILPVNRKDLDITVDSPADDPSIFTDPNTRKVLVNISWKENGTPTEIELVSYISRH